MSVRIYFPLMSHNLAYPRIFFVSDNRKYGDYNMNTKMTLPFADTICGDVRKIIDAIFKDCRQEDIDRLFLRSYSITNERFLIDDYNDSRSYKFVFTVGGERFPDDVKFKLHIYCEYLYDPEPIDEFELFYELNFYENSHTIKNLFKYLHSALAYCDGYVDGVMNKHDINIDDYDLEIE